MLNKILKLIEKRKTETKERLLVSSPNSDWLSFNVHLRLVNLWFINLKTEIQRDLAVMHRHSH